MQKVVSYIPFNTSLASQPLHPAHYASRHPAYLQPAQLHNATAAIIAGSQSLHQKRATDVLAEFDTLLAECTGPVSLFIFHYSCCEALALLLVGTRKGIPPHKLFDRKGPNVDLRKTKSAVKRLHLPLSKRTLNLIFQMKGRGGSRSCRALRNGILHGLRRDRLFEVTSRHRKLIVEMRKFIESIRSKAQRGHHF